MKGKTLAQKESPPWRTRTTLTLHHPKRRLGRQRTGCMHVTCVTRYFRRAAHCWDTNMSTQVCQWAWAQGSKSACDLLHRKNTGATCDLLRILQEVVSRPLLHSYSITAFALCVHHLSSASVFTVWGQWAEWQEADVRSILHPGSGLSSSSPEGFKMKELCCFR